MQGGRDRIFQKPLRSRGWLLMMSINSWADLESGTARHFIRRGVNQKPRSGSARIRPGITFIQDLPDAIARFLSKPGAGESTPFGPDVLVYKVGGKMFPLTGPDEFPARLNLKCDPERALALRDEYEAILPGYHMNKRHWNTLVLDGSLPAELVRELIDHCYELVVASLPKSWRSNV